MLILYEDGYDNDGTNEPFYDAIELEGEQLFEEDDMPEVDVYAAVNRDEAEGCHKPCCY